MQACREDRGLLKKHNVSTRVAQLLPQLVQHQVLMKWGETLVDVVGRDVESHMIHGVYDAESILSCAWLATFPIRPEQNRFHPVSGQLQPLWSTAGSWQ